MKKLIEPRRSTSEAGGRARPAAGAAVRIDGGAAGGGSLVLLACWFGLAAGLTEVALRAVQQYGLGERISLSQQFVWMAPVADVVLYGVIGAAAAALALRWPRHMGAGVVVFLCVFVYIAAPLLVFERLHAAAVVLVAAGVAYRAAVTARRRTGRLLGIARRTWAPMAGLVVLLAAAVNGGLVLGERARLAGLPAGGADRPNVVLIILDTVRAASLRLHGYARETTPNLDRLARTSVVFDHAIATAPWTLPSHASMFTGQFPDVLDADWKTPLGPERPTLAEVFASRGYRTGGFSGNVLYATYETGLDRGFTRFEDYPVSVGMIVASSFPARLLVTGIRDAAGLQGRLVRRPATHINDGLFGWLDDPAQRERPFFAFVNYFDAHDPYLPPAPFDTLFGGIRPGKPLSFFEPWSAEELARTRDAYDAAIAYVDHQLGVLLDGLEQRSLLERTIIVVTSDHGEQLGEHDLAYHANSLYLPLLHVPLMVRLPDGRGAGTRIPETVSLAELPATILSMAGIDEGVLPGASLLDRSGRAPAWPTRAARAYVSRTINMAARLPASRGDMAAVTAGSFHYIRNGDGREELYDFAADPLETRDLARVPEFRHRLEELRALLDARGRAADASETRQ